MHSALTAPIAHGRPENLSSYFGERHFQVKKNVKPSLNITNKKLDREWHRVKNAPLTPRDVNPGSGKEIWWVCRQGHEWKAAVLTRKQGGGCPFCSGRRPTKENSLETRGPLIAREWHPTKNAWWTPKDVAPSSLREVWWICKKGHEWREPICNRYKRGGCPVCTLKARVPRLFERDA